MTKEQINKLNREIDSICINWQDVFARNNTPKNLVALNFGLQKIYDGYEIYLDGYDWFDEQDDIWLLDSIWGPDENFISLSYGFNLFDEAEVFSIYNKNISEKIRSGKMVLPATIKYATVCLVKGKPQRVM